MNYWKTGAPEKRGVYKNDEYRGVMISDEVAQQVCTLYNYAQHVPDHVWDNLEIIIEEGNRE